VTSHEIRRVVFGEGALAIVKEQLAQSGLSHAFVVTTKGRHRELEELKNILGEALSGIYDEAIEHVPVSVTGEAAEILATSGADVIVALGGGSAIGLGKALVRRSGLPLAAIPTTYSGSEMTSIYGETDEGGKKTGRDPLLMPRLVFYDPLLTLDLRVETSAASGLNAMAHSVEALYAPNVNEYSERYARESIRLLATSLPAVVADPQNVIARENALKGAQLAGDALESTAMGLHHRICHVLGGSFGMPHAKTHAVMLRYVVAYNYGAAPDAMRMIEDAMNVENAIDGIAGLCDRLPVPRTLGTIGFTEQNVGAAADEIASRSYPNPRVATETDVVRILRAALKGASPTVLTN
jgi:maleylacetate reductase